MKLFKKPSSEAVAAKMLFAMKDFSTLLQRKQNLSGAERRHLLRLRSIKVLEANQDKERESCQQTRSNQNVRQPD